MLLGEFFYVIVEIVTSFQVVDLLSSVVFACVCFDCHMGMDHCESEVNK